MSLRHSSIKGERGLSQASSRFVITAIALCLVLLFDFFVGMPLQGAASLAKAILVFLALFIGYLLLLRPSPEPKGKALYYVLILSVVIPVYSAWRAAVTFDQPWLYGLLSERNWLSIAAGPILFILLQERRITFRQLKFAFIVLAWASLAAFSFLALLYVTFPEQFAPHFNISAISNSDHRGLRVKLPTHFVVFGAIYYFVKANGSNTGKNILLASLFIIYLIFVARGRFEALILALVILFFLSYYKAWQLLRPSLAVAILWCVIIYCFQNIQADIAPPKIQGNIETSQVQSEIASPEIQGEIAVAQNIIADLKSLVVGQRADDHGLNARADELRIVGEIFAKSPKTILYGTGRLSHQWEDGFKSKLGYFFPSDIGIVGAVFVYGLPVYLSVVLLSLGIAIRYLRYLRRLNDEFMVASGWLLVFYLIYFLLGVPFFLSANFYISLFIFGVAIKMWESPTP